MTDEYEAVLAGYRKFANMASKASVENIAKFQPRPDDVILSGLKSGSTWVQQIVHNLRSRGDMNFDEINKMIPCLELVLDDGMDFEAPQPWTPRCFKTHFARTRLKDGPRYIFVARDPKDMVVSSYDFIRGWMIPKDAPLDIFVQIFFLEPPTMDVWNTYVCNFHELIAGWWPYRNDPKVLWLHYEDLKQNLPAAVEEIAEFMGLDITDKELLDIATKQASFNFMKANQDKYLTRKRNGEVANSKVHVGVMNRKALLSEETAAKMDANWQEVLGKVYGLPDYATMRSIINKEAGRSWAS